MIGRAASPSEKTARGNIIPQAREVLPRMRDQHDLAGRGDLHVPQNPDGALLVSWPPARASQQPQTVKPITSEQVDQTGSGLLLLRPERASK